MTTRLSKPVVRFVEVSLRGVGFRDGFVARVSEEGVTVKPQGSRWHGPAAMLATWGDVLTIAAQRRADEVRRARAERRRLKKAGAL